MAKRKNSSRAIVITIWVVKRLIGQHPKTWLLTWRWHAQSAGNWKIIADGAEGYCSRCDCEHGIALMLGLSDRAVRLGLRGTDRMRMRSAPLDKLDDPDEYIQANWYVVDSLSPVRKRKGKHT